MDILASKRQERMVIETMLTEINTASGPNQGEAAIIGAEEAALNKDGKMTGVKGHGVEPLREKRKDNQKRKIRDGHARDVCVAQ